MRLSPVILAVRAIGSELLRRQLFSVLTAVFVALAVAHTINIILISFSVWWWVTEILLISTTVILLPIIGLILLAVYRLRPNQTSTQEQVVRNFADVFSEVLETSQIPQLLLLLRLAKDMVAPRGMSFIEYTAIKTVSLKSGFEAVVGAFSYSD